jgi:MHS family proline/betaine transporter-like MFS transporter
MVEHSPKNRRAISGSAAMASLVMGFLLGSIVTTAFTTMLSTEDFESWGWRIPFLLGIIVGIVGFYIRSHCEESPVYETAKAGGTLSKRPIRDAFAKHPTNMLQAFVIYLFVTMPFYMLSIYFITFTTKQLEQPYGDALLINAFAMLAMLVSIPISAIISDRIGRKKVLIFAIILMMIVVYPAFLLMHDHGNFNSILLGQVMLGLTIGIYLAPVPALLVECFPTSVRYTGMSLSYNLCAILGGLVPLVSTWLIATSCSNDSIMYIIIISGLLSLVGLITYRDKWQDELN